MISGGRRIRRGAPRESSSEVRDMPIYHTVKYPAGGGDLNQDYHKAEGAEEAERKFPGT